MPKWRLSHPNCAILNEIFLTRKRFSDNVPTAKNLRVRKDAPHHDATVLHQVSVPDICIPKTVS